MVSHFILSAYTHTHNFNCSITGFSSFSFLRPYCYTPRRVISPSFFLQRFPKLRAFFYREISPLHEVYFPLYECFFHFLFTLIIISFVSYLIARIQKHLKVKESGAVFFSRWCEYQHGVCCCSCMPCLWISFNTVTARSR